MIKPLALLVYSPTENRKIKNIFDKLLIKSLKFLNCNNKYEPKLSIMNEIKRVKNQCKKKKTLLEY